MKNKVKFILIAVEVFVLAVLLLIGVGCQQKWIIVTGDGPRFDWYAVQENLVPDLDLPEEPSDDPAPEPSDEPETSEPATTAPPATRPPETSEPPETTEPPASDPANTEDSTHTPDTPDTTEDRWSLGEF